jgi:ABC-type glycerol-3-phosphate transport system substrate-binding protein
MPKDLFGFLSGPERIGMRNSSAQRAPETQTPRGHPALAIALAITLLLASCSPGGAPEAAEPTALPADANAEAGAAVTIGFGAPKHERPRYEPLIAGFNQQNPGIHVQFIALDEFDGAGDPALALRRIAGAADTALVADVRVAYLQAGLLRDLKPLMDADARTVHELTQPADFYPGAIGRLRGSR